MMLCEGLGQQGEVWLGWKSLEDWVIGRGAQLAGVSRAAAAVYSLLLLEIQGLCVLALLP